jgi:hypothetical protein
MLLFSIHIISEKLHLKPTDLKEDFKLVNVLKIEVCMLPCPDHHLSRLQA